jgi:hypothetical protein
MRARVVVAAAAVIGCTATPIQAATVLGLGIGAASGASGGLEGPGVSAWTAVLWPVERWIRVGAMLHVDDHGTEIGRLLDPNDGTDLGATATDHRMVIGGAWRADFPFRLSRTWGGLAGATVGYYRVQNDVVGVVESAFSTSGVSGALGVHRSSWIASDIGITFRYHYAFDERLDPYGSLTLDWTWQTGTGASAPKVAGTAPAKGN